MSGNLKKSALKLGLAGGIEYGLQVAIPVILVRTLPQADFAQFRLLWLLASTVLALLPLFMPNSLFYFLARADNPLRRAQTIGNVLLYLVGMALVVGLVLNPWNIWLPPAVHGLLQHGWPSIFLMLWLICSIFDFLPVAEMRSGWQSNATVALAIIRTILLALAASQTHQVVWVLAALVLLAVLKLGVFAAYLMKSSSASPRLAVDRALFKTQFAYALPFGIGTALFLMRAQVDQWVVVTLLSPALYASFSIAAVLQPVATLLRLPVINAMMPHLNKAASSGDDERIRHLLTQSNALTAMLLVPVAGLFWVCAPQLVQIVYTHAYLDAAPVMQVYLLGMMINGFAIGHVLPVLEKGRFATLNHAVSLVLSLLFSLLGVHFLGLPGAALGSVGTMAFSELWSARVVAAHLKLSVARLLSWHALWPTLAATILALGVVHFACAHLAWLALPLLLLKGFAYVGLWLATFLLCGGWQQAKKLRHFG
jgi:O-antigen/teichoic acid export membrane protein